MTITVRPVTLDDAATMATMVHEGFLTYHAFVPAGWAPPTVEDERTRIRQRLGLPDAWGRLAEDGDDPAGLVAFLSAREEGAVVPGRAHLWLLFVGEPWWGTGLATRLLALAVGAAAAQGYAMMRLYTPADHGRARAFYEREGWVPHGASRWDPMLALDLVEYRRALG